MLMYYIWWEIKRVQNVEELSLEELKNLRTFNSEEELEVWTTKEFQRLYGISNDVMRYVNVNMWFLESLLGGRYRLYYIEDTGTFVLQSGKKEAEICG